MATINQLPLLTTLAGEDNFVVWSPNNGDSRRVPYSVIKDDTRAGLMTLTEPGTFANKTFNLNNNTLIGTLSQFNAACTDADFVSVAALAASTGASTVGFTQAGAGAVLRTAQNKMRDVASLKDFGAVGDGAANDTTAVAAAVAYMESTGYPVYVPPGTYLTDPIQTDSQTYALQAFFYGDEYASTIIRRRGTGAGAFITIGDPLATAFQANIVCSNITFDGGPNTNGPCVTTYDMVRSAFTNVDFKGGSVAYSSQGGIANTFNHCLFRDAVRGFVAEAFVASGSLSPAGGGWPNIIRLNDCHAVDNTEWGIWFNDGRMLIVEGCQVESNGTTLAAAQGGIYVGPDIGTEVTVTDPESIGIVINDCWVEANRGIADIQLTSGINSVSNSNFFSQSTAVTNDIRIDGGRYRLRNLNMSFAKTTNVLENSGAGIGNTIDFVQAAALSYNSSKTAVNDGWRAFLGNGAVPGINGATAPLILVGTDATSANPTITFTQAFKAATTPRVYTQVVNNSTGTLETPEVYSVSNTAFTLRKKSFNGTTISTSNYTVTWLAIGENP